jgi:hypothetical protein
MNEEKPESNEPADRISSRIPPNLLRRQLLMAFGDVCGSSSPFISKLAEERGKITAASITIRENKPRSHVFMCLTKNPLSEKPNVRSDQRYL